MPILTMKFNYAEGGGSEFRTNQTANILQRDGLISFQITKSPLQILPPVPKAGSPGIIGPLESRSQGLREMSHWKFKTRGKMYYITDLV